MFSKQKSVIYLSIVCLVMLWILLFGISMSSADTRLKVTPTPTWSRTPADMDLLSEFEHPESDEDCELPCWWDMYPGVTSEEEVIEILTSRDLLSRHWEGPLEFDSSIKPRSGHLYLDVGPTNFDTNTSFDMGIVVKNEMLESIDVTVRRPDLWLPENSNLVFIRVINDLESIPDIYLNTPPLRELRLNLVYIDEGLMITYQFDVLGDRTQFWMTGDTLELCLSENPVQVISLRIQNLESEEAIEERVTLLKQFISPIETVTDITSEELINFFRETPDECLEMELKELEE